jgi:hypothetical protein
MGFARLMTNAGTSKLARNTRGKVFGVVKAKQMKVKYLTLPFPSKYKDLAIASLSSLCIRYDSGIRLKLVLKTLAFAICLNQSFLQA